MRRFVLPLVALTAWTFLSISSLGQRASETATSPDEELHSLLGIEFYEPPPITIMSNPERQEGSLWQSEESSPGTEE